MHIYLHMYILHMYGMYVYTKLFRPSCYDSPQPDIFMRQFYVNILRLKLIVKKLSCDCEVKIS